MVKKRVKTQEYGLSFAYIPYQTRKWKDQIYIKINYNFILNNKFSRTTTGVNISIDRSLLTSIPSKNCNPISWVLQPLSLYVFQRIKKKGNCVKLLIAAKVHNSVSCGFLELKMVLCIGLSCQYDIRNSATQLAACP